MPNRIEIAYVLIACMVVAIGGLIAYSVYNSRVRTYHRRIKREYRAHASKLKDQSKSASSRASDQVP